VKKKLEENKKNQRVFDNYIDRAVTNSSIFARRYHGYNLFVSGKNATEGVCALRSAGSAQVRSRELAAGKTNAKFYQGDFGSCAVVITAGVFVAVRIGKEIYYAGVKNSDRSAVMDVARRSHCIYDMRALPIQAIARHSKNVIHYAF
tara:strand:- start:64 stop:504 length:441 start_codon:yes stop_codon:yes gene_type:complete